MQRFLTNNITLAFKICQTLGHENLIRQKENNHKKAEAIFSFRSVSETVLVRYFGAQTYLFSEPAIWPRQTPLRRRFWQRMCTRPRRRGERSGSGASR